MHARALNHRHGQWHVRPGLSIMGALALLLTACGSGLSGEYSDQAGMLQYDFKSDGKVYMTTFGIQVASEYRVDDDKVIIQGNNGNMVLDMKDDGTLSGPLGMVLSKHEEHR